MDIIGNRPWYKKTDCPWDACADWEVWIRNQIPDCYENDFDEMCEPLKSIMYGIFCDLSDGITKQRLKERAEMLKELEQWINIGR